ncbi:hypothetical protein B0H16DRAFT_1502284, partial [Mycena metata]
MHPRNPHIIPPDFRELARAYPPLRQPCLMSYSGGSSIDFHNCAEAINNAEKRRDSDGSFPPPRL